MFMTRRRISPLSHRFEVFAKATDVKTINEWINRLDDRPRIPQKPVQLPLGKHRLGVRNRLLTRRVPECNGICGLQDSGSCEEL